MCITTLKVCITMVVMLWAVPFMRKHFLFHLMFLEGSTKVVNMCYIRKRKSPVYNAML